MESLGGMGIHAGSESRTLCSLLSSCNSSPCGGLRSAENTSACLHHERDVAKLVRT